DPVAVMALMGGSKYRPNKTLHSLVFGESVLNDAVAIVLFAAYQQAYFSPRGTSSGLAQSPLLHFLTGSMERSPVRFLAGTFVKSLVHFEYPSHIVKGIKCSHEENPQVDEAGFTALTRRRSQAGVKGDQSTGSGCQSIVPQAKILMGIALF
ncbi:hypothetical protein FOZ62_021976, partial [Perkinsus olseni]